MKITPRFDLIESEDNAEIVQICSEGNKYSVCQKKIDEKTHKIEPLDNPQNSNYYDNLIKCLEQIKQKNPNVRYANYDKKSIIFVTYKESDKKDKISKIEICNLNEEESGGKDAIYMGVVYKLTIFNSKVAFLYYYFKNNETIYGIKVFETIDDLFNQKVLKDFEMAHIGKINDIQFTLDCKHIISCGDDGIVKIWNLQTQDPPQSIILANGPIASVRLNRFDESLFVAACADGYLIFYSTQKHQAKKTIRISNNESENPENKSQDPPFAGPVIWADFSPKDPYLAVTYGLFNEKPDFKTYYIANLFD